METPGQRGDAPYALVVLQIALLGPLEVRRDSRRVHVPSGKASELLVRLAFEAGEPVRTDRLIDDLWASGARNTRRNTLQSKVAMLRRGLGDPAAIVNRDGGYAVTVEPSEVDGLAVMAYLAAASRLLGAGDDRGAADLCASAPGALPRGGASGRRRRGLGQPAQGPARGNAPEAEVPESSTRPSTPLTPVGWTSSPRYRPVCWPPQKQEERGS